MRPSNTAEAILSAYEVCKDSTIARCWKHCRGLLGRKEKVLEVAVDAMKSAESIRGIRNLVILAQTIGSIDPALLKAFAGALPQALIQAKQESNQSARAVGPLQAALSQRQPPRSFRRK